MGGRGSASSRARSANRYSGAINYLNRIEETAPKNTAIGKETVKNVKAMKDILSAGRYKNINESRSIAVIARNGGGRPSKDTLDLYLKGRERPLCLSDSGFDNLKNHISKLNSQGYSNREIAAVLQFGDIINRNT